MVFMTTNDRRAANPPPVPRQPENLTASLDPTLIPAAVAVSVVALERMAQVGAKVHANREQTKQTQIRADADVKIARIQYHPPQSGG